MKEKEDSSRTMMSEDELTVAATGDSMISRRISVLKEEEFLSAIKVTQNADVAFTNCEILFHNYESFPMKTTGFATFMAADPSMAEELKWAGFNLLALPNNHSMDYGHHGIFSTMETLDRLKMVHAGAGRSLDEAGEPKYLDTGKGRVALIASCADPAPLLELWQRATNTGRGIAARPGINMVRLDCHYVVGKKSFENLKDIKKELKMSDPEGKKHLAPDELMFADRKFKQGDKIGSYKVPKKQDVERDLLSIKDAKRCADWVFVSLHSHGGSVTGSEYPDDFLCQYARACIDAGADAFLGHGPHILRGIEIYKGKPIFYSLGQFIVQNDTVRRISSEQYELFGLDEKARPSDFYEARRGIIPPTEPPQAQWWTESVIAKFSFKQERLREVKLYPIVFPSESRVYNGCPKMAKAEKAREIIEHLRNISAPWATQIDYEDGIGVVKLPVG